MQWAKNNAPIAGTLAATNAAAQDNHQRNKQLPFHEPLIGNSMAITKLNPSGSVSNNQLNQIDTPTHSKSNKTHYTTTYRSSYQKP